MIDSLSITSVPDNCMPWVESLDYFKRQPTTAFKPGLNILFGANGSGKSTVLQLLAQSLAAVQGGTSVVTQSWLQDVCAFGGSELKLPCEVIHDGKPVMFFDARAKEGLIGGGFDDDFFGMGVANAMAKGSTGQLGLRRLDRLLAVLVDDIRATQAGAGPAAAPAAAEKPKRRTKKAEAEPTPKQVPGKRGFPTEIEWRIQRKMVNDTWKARFAVVEKLLEAKRAVGPQTLLFDEPESGFSLPWQAGLWTNIFAKVDPAKYQVIVATHSPFALGLPGVNYIEMSPGYLAETKAAVASLVGRILAGGRV